MGVVSDPTLRSLGATATRSSEILTVALRRRRLGLLRRPNELRLEEAHLVAEIGSRLSQPWSLPVDAVAGVASVGSRPGRELDPDLQLSRSPRLPMLVDHPSVVPNLMVVFRTPQPVPEGRGWAGRFAQHPVDGVLLAACDVDAALSAFAERGLAVGDGAELIAAAIGVEADTERLRTAAWARRRTRGLILAGAALASSLLLGIYVNMPGSLLGGGCPDSGPSLVAAVTEPVLESFEGSTLTAAGRRPVAQVLEGRAKYDDLFAAATKAGASGGWAETWAFPDGGELDVQTLTFDDAAGASAYGDYDATFGCPHTIATHRLGDTGVRAVQANRPGDADGWEAIVVEDREVHRLYVVSEDQPATLRRLQTAVELINDVD